MRTHDDDVTSPLAVEGRSGTNTSNGPLRETRPTSSAGTTTGLGHPSRRPSGPPSRPPSGPRVVSSVRAPGWSTTGAPRDGVPAPLTPTPGPGRQALLVRLAVLVLVAGVVATVALVVAREARVSGDGRDQAVEEVPALQVDPAPIQLGSVGQPVGLGVPAESVLPRLPGPAPAGPAAPSRAAPSPGIDPARGSLASLAAWSRQLAVPTGIPARALQAYGLADLVMRRLDPGCHLSWVTVAGLARIESNHGRFHGSSVGADGEVSPAIVGVPLDGTNGNTTITDGGAYAAAMGPLQFIPSTWLRWGVDTHGTGRADINNIDDAAVTAGRYLCAAGGDLATGPGWRAGVLAYNASEDYARRVYTAADAYAHGTTT